MARKLGAEELASFVREKFNESKRSLRNKYSAASKDYWQIVFGPHPSDDGAVGLEECLEVAGGKFDLALVLLEERTMPLEQVWQRSQMRVEQAEMAADVFECRYDLEIEEHRVESIRLSTLLREVRQAVQAAKDATIAWRPCFVFSYHE